MSRTTALHEALGELHGQLEELREDHKQLQVMQAPLYSVDTLTAVHRAAAQRHLQLGGLANWLASRPCARLCNALGF